MQWTMEAKFQAGQEIYRFEASVPPGGLETIMIDFIRMKIVNPKRQETGNMRRRPLFLSEMDQVAGKW